MGELISGRLQFGRDGWLFLAGGSNGAFGLLDGSQPLAEATYCQWQARIRDRRAALCGLQVAFLICPEKAAVYPEYTQDLRPDPNRPACQLARDHGVIYPDRALAGLPESYTLTGSHFNDRGALIASRAVLERWGITDGIEPQWRLEPYSSNMAKSGLSDPPEDRYWHLANAPALKRLDNGVSNRGRVVIWAPYAPSAHGRRLVIFGDSFSMHLARFFAASFDEVIMVHSLSFDAELTRRLAPSHVLFEWAERFLRTAPEEQSLTQVLADKIRGGDRQARNSTAAWLEGTTPRQPDADLFVDRPHLQALVNAPD